MLLASSTNRTSIRPASHEFPQDLGGCRRFSAIRPERPRTVVPPTHFERNSFRHPGLESAAHLLIDGNVSNLKSHRSSYGNASGKIPSFSPSFVFLILPFAHPTTRLSFLLFLSINTGVSNVWRPGPACSNALATKPQWNDTRLCKSRSSVEHWPVDIVCWRHCFSCAARMDQNHETSRTVVG